MNPAYDCQPATTTVVLILGIPPLVAQASHPCPLIYEMPSIPCASQASVRSNTWPQLLCAVSRERREELPGASVGSGFPICCAVSSIGRPWIVRTRRYLSPSQQSILFSGGRRSAQAVRSRRNGGTAATENSCRFTFDALSAISERTRVRA